MTRGRVNTVGEKIRLKVLPVLETTCTGDIGDPDTCCG